MNREKKFRATVCVTILALSVLFAQCNKSAAPVGEKQKTEDAGTPAAEKKFESIQRSDAIADTASFKIKIEELSDAIKADPENPHNYAARGDLKKFLGDVEGACADWKKAKELGLKNLEVAIEKNCK